MYRRVLLAAALALAALGISAAPAQAIPIGGPSYQLVTLYFSDAGLGDFVGETWTGCPSNPAGSWGIATQHSYRYTLEC